ncbi:hypothetical protein AS188_07850 [Kocuria flava]|uniref:Uncharacterized protein n=2 Tax=Kocuria TaxID=57493 RepID=A0A0U3GHR2_9MICC|nr:MULTISPECIES: hypothetical protein [Kocuria]ALU39678.1 hypothetical protein AS188_07850 [Kocuria flava]GEO92303.1 hypothetical protein KFL01_16090 [Kocuria flava]GEO97249.1 hypothetical protein KTU01_33720 [Kocuria turfanensis]
MSPTASAPTEGATSTCLGPDCAFPADLSALSLIELHVLHSQICRQLDREYLTTPEGAHPFTLDRHQEVLAELDARESALASTAPVH